MILIQNYELENITNKELSLAFDTIFKKILNDANNQKAEFTLLHYHLGVNFEDLISNPLEKEYQGIKAFLETAFLNFINKNY